MPEKREGGFWWRAGIIGWGIIFVLAGALEYVGLRRRDDDFPPLTHILKRALPKWALAAGIGALSFWLLQHFVIS